jgi:carboxyl-terminal processing protease
MEYFMNSRLIRIFLGILIVTVLFAGTFSIGLIVGSFLPAQVQATSIPEAVGSSLFNLDPGSILFPGTRHREQLFRPFWETWQIVHDQYVDQPVDDEALMRGAIKGMLDALEDDHTSYMDPEQYQRANIPLQGEYEGIGAWVDPNREYLTITSPMPGSPAEQAGLKPGDQIIAIDGDDMTGIDGNLALRRVLGPAGTSVTLTISREGVDLPFDVVIKRASINVPSVESEMLEGNIAYIQLLTFGDHTTADLRSSLQELMRQNPEGLILDLRNNVGGYLHTAIEVASEFIGDGVIMYEEYGDGKIKTFEALKGGRATKIPMVVLINEGSASASEIVAGAIQDRGRGLLVGTTSFGKGSVQHWTELKNNQGAVRVTIARWLTPDKRQINKLGLEPDIAVILNEEDIESERDPQLDKAIEYLLNQDPE